jgi:hypothetical protein
VSAIAEELLKTEYDVVRIIFNRFQSAISFKPTIATVLSPDALEKEVEAGGSLDQYETEGPDRAEMLQDLAEFQLAAVSGCCPGAVPCMHKCRLMPLISADSAHRNPRIAAGSTSSSNQAAGVSCACMFHVQDVCGVRTKHGAWCMNSP